MSKLEDYIEQTERDKIEEYIRQVETKKKTSPIMCTAFGFIVVALIFSLLRFNY